jgi:protein gp37
MPACTKIEWTDMTWNPVTGCSKISPGCKNCYAERLAIRLQAMGNPSYSNGFEVTLHSRLLDSPLHWKSRKMVFVNSMSDLFHEEVPTEFIHKVFSVMEKAKQHLFQILTKRSERLLELSNGLRWPHNVWMGVTVENKSCLYRIDHLRQTGANTKFLSCEPLLGALNDLNLEGMDWVIVGGESGPGARPMSQTWVREIRDRCIQTQTPFFFKQWGGTNKKKAGRILDGKTWDEYPGDHGDLEDGLNCLKTVAQ